MQNLEEGLRWLDQAKALKGYLYAKGFRAIITHSVTELLEESSKHEKVFAKFIDPGKELDRHYIGSRYPNFYPTGPAYKYYTEEIAKRCVEYAESILKEAEKFIRR